MANAGAPLLVTESQSSRTFTLHAEDWAKPITQPIYVVGRVESNSPTMHPSAPIALQVSKDAEKKVSTTVRRKLKARMAAECSQPVSQGLVDALLPATRTSE